MKGAVLLILMTGVAFPLVVGYHVDPVRASWSGWTHRGFQGFRDAILNSPLPVRIQ